MSEDTRRLRILIVDDHMLVAQCFSLALEVRGVQADLADLESFDAVVAQVRRTAPDLVLLDLNLGPIGAGEPLVPRIVAAGSRVLVVSAADDRMRFAAAVEMGAVGMVDKSSPFQGLLDTVVRAARGEQVLAAAERHLLLSDLHRHRAREQDQQQLFARLTAREREVLHHLTDGHNVGQIARRCYVSEATVRSQVRSILAKLGVRSQLEAVACASRGGWYTRTSA